MSDLIRIVIGLIVSVLLLKSGYLVIRIAGGWIFIVTILNIYYLFTTKNN